VKASVISLGWHTIRKSTYGYSVGIAVYILFLAWVYPSLATNPAVTRLLSNLPPVLLKLAGVSSNFSTYTGYLSGEFYSVIDIWIIMWFVTMEAMHLVGTPRQNHSLQWWLSSPISRSTWMLGQFLALALALVFLTGATMASEILGAWWFNGGHVYWSGMIWLNLVALFTGVLIAGYSMVFLAWVPTVTLPLTITLIFYAMNLIGGMAPHLGFLSTLSIFGVYQPSLIAAGAVPTLSAILAFILGSAILAWLASLVFARQDLTL
jgi:ABC-2 type transport system permease protein